MPFKSEKLLIVFTEHDRRIKITDEIRESIIKEYATGKTSHRKLAAKYGVSKTTIENVLNPDKYQKQLKRYKAENHSAKYYNKDKWKDYIKQHRRYKQSLYKKGIIGGEENE